MKKKLLFLSIILILAFSLVSCGQPSQAEPEPELLLGTVLLPRGAVLHTESKSVSYDEALEYMNVFGYDVAVVPVDWLFSFDEMWTSLGERNLSLYSCGENTWFAALDMNEKEIETLRDKAAEILYYQNNQETLSHLMISNPVLLADRYAVLEAVYGEGKEASFLVHLDDLGNWFEEDFLNQRSLNIELYPHLSYINPDVKIDGKTPYALKVNRQENCLTVYTLDSNGKYTKAVKAMICSAGREGHESPAGEYAINDFRPRWCYMVDGSYGQYVSGWRSGGYLFHTICYEKQSRDSMMEDEYNLLGSNASLGCIRLQTIDAKWIYDNCIQTTPVTIYDDDNPGPLGKPERLIDYIDETSANGWDPTDPHPDNPWRTRF